MDTTVVVSNADGVETTHYLLCKNTDAYAVVADAWKDAPEKVAFPRLHGGSRQPVGDSFRNPLASTRRYEPASQMDLELARIAYNFDYPKYIAGQTKPAADFDTEVKVDVMTVVDYAPDSRGGRWLQAWV